MEGRNCREFICGRKEPWIPQWGRILDPGANSWRERERKKRRQSKTKKKDALTFCFVPERTKLKERDEDSLWEMPSTPGGNKHSYHQRWEPQPRRFSNKQNKLIKRILVFLVKVPGSCHISTTSYSLSNLVFQLLLWVCTSLWGSSHTCCICVFLVSICLTLTSFSGPAGDPKKVDVKFGAPCTAFFWQRATWWPYPEVSPVHTPKKPGKQQSGGKKPWVINVTCLELHLERPTIFLYFELGWES